MTTIIKGFLALLIASFFTVNNVYAQATGGLPSVPASGLPALSGDVTSSKGSAVVTVNAINGLPVTPGGRLSLSSTLAIPTADLATVSTVYYLPYLSQLLPIYTGSKWLMYGITNSGISLTLNATNMPSGKIYDVYALNNSGTPTLCAMYWGAATSRSTTVGGQTGSANSSIANVGGIWVNNAAIATNNCYNGTTAYAIAQNQGTVLGSFYANTNGTTTFLCNPAAASGGNIILVAIFNMYNRIQETCSNRDSATSITSASASWTQLGVNASMDWLDGIGVPFQAEGMVVAGNNTLGDCGYFGMQKGGGNPTTFAATCGPTGTLVDNYQTLSSFMSGYGALGLNVASEKISSAAGTTTYMPVTGQEITTLTVSW